MEPLATEYFTVSLNLIQIYVPANTANNEGKFFLKAETEITKGSAP